MNRGVVESITVDGFVANTSRNKGVILHIIPSRRDNLLEKIRDKVGCKIEWNEDALNRVTGFKVLNDPSEKLKIIVAVKHKDLERKYNLFCTSVEVIRTKELFNDSLGKYELCIYYKFKEGLKCE